MVALFPPIVRIGRMARLLAGDRRGVTAVATGLAFVVLAGFAGVALDVGSWQAAKRRLQSVADQAAYSAAIGGNSGQSGYTNAEAVAAQLGFGCSAAGTPDAGGKLSCSGAKGVTVAVNNPPAQGAYANDSVAWEVVVSQPQPLWFSRFFLKQAPVASARAVALQNGKGGNVCILALDTRTGDIHSVFGGLSGTVTVGGSCIVADNLLNTKDTDSVDVKSGAVLNLAGLYMRVSSKCDGGNCNGTLNVSSPIQYNQPAIVDPYASRTIPADTDCSGGTNLVIAASTTLNPGNYCGTGGKPAIVVENGVSQKTTLAGSGTTLTVGSTSGIIAGMTVSDTNNANAIAAGTTVTAVPDGTTVTISSSAALVKKGDTVKFASPGGTTVTLNPGVYILDGKGGGSCGGTTKPSNCFSGDFDITGGAVVTGTGVTIVLTTDTGVGINVGNMNIDDGSALTITAPTSNVGGYQVSGMAIWQNPIAPFPTDTDGNHFNVGDDGINTISSGGSTDITGVVYFPSQALFYQGGSGGSACTQIIAWAVSFKSSAQFNYPSNCTQTAGVLPIGGTPMMAE